MLTRHDDTINVITNNAGGIRENGLTKLEYFSALALQGILSGTSGVEALASVHNTSWAESAVQCAESLICELNKRRDQCSKN